MHVKFMHHIYEINWHSIGTYVLYFTISGGTLVIIIIIYSPLPVKPVIIVVFFLSKLGFPEFDCYDFQNLKFNVQLHNEKLKTKWFCYRYFISCIVKYLFENIFSSLPIKRQKARKLFSHCFINLKLPTKRCTSLCTSLFLSFCFFFNYFIALNFF